MAGSQRRKHIPQRTCIICRCTLAKRDLNRLVRTPDGVRCDPSGKAPGRGAYLCQNPRCWDTAIQGNALDRALKTKLTSEERMALRSEMENCTTTDLTTKSNPSEALN